MLSKSGALILTGLMLAAVGCEKAARKSESSQTTNALMLASEPREYEYATRTAGGGGGGGVGENL
jgi:hypothetical protein